MTAMLLTAHRASLWLNQCSKDEGKMLGLQLLQEVRDRQCVCLVCHARSTGRVEQFVALDMHVYNSR